MRRPKRQKGEHGYGEKDKKRSKRAGECGGKGKRELFQAIERRK